MLFCQAVVWTELALPVRFMSVAVLFPGLFHVSGCCCRCFWFLLSMLFLVFLFWFVRICVIFVLICNSSLVLYGACTLFLFVCLFVCVFVYLSVCLFPCLLNVLVADNMYLRDGSV